MSNEWEEKARQGRERRERLMSFGPNAFAVLAQTDDGVFAVDPEDSSVSSALLHHGSYARHEVDLCRAFFTGGDVLVVGSHIGAHVVSLARHADNLVAIEANPHTYKLLQANTRLNNFDNVHCYNVAAGESSGRIRFVLNRENSGGSKRMPNAEHVHYFYDNPDVVEVDLVALDELLGPRAFNFILMDIEGSETFAIRGMPRLLDRAGALAIEFLPHHLKDVAGVTPEEFVEPLVENFSWLYVPSQRLAIPRHQIAAKVKAMYEAGEGHDLIVFSKSLPGRLGVSEGEFELRL